MKKLLAIVMVMVFMFSMGGMALAQDDNFGSNIATLPLQTNTIDPGETEIETGDATGGDHNWAIAANVPITIIGSLSGSSDFRGQSYTFNIVTVTNGNMCANANGGGNANTGGNTLKQTIKQKNVIRQKIDSLFNNL